MKRVWRWGGSALLWAVTLLMALWMMNQGASKFGSYSGWVLWFGRWGYPRWLVPVTGVLELTGGLLLLWPTISAYAALMLACVMAGALLTVTTHTTDLSWADPLFGMAMFTVLGIVRWKARWRRAHGVQRPRRNEGHA